MSHQITIKTEIDNEQCLMKALDQLGYQYKTGEKLVTQGVYWDEQRECDILLGGEFKNSVGLKKQKNGTYSLVGGGYNNQELANKAKKELTTRSKEIEATERFQKMNFSLKAGSRIENNKKVSLTLQQWVN